MAVRGKAADRPADKAPVNGAEPETAATENQPEKESEKANDKSPDLTPEQTFALTSQWSNKVTAQQDRVNDAKSAYDSEKGNLRQLYKQVKAELGDEGVDRVKELVKLELDEDGESKLRARLETLRWVAQWANALGGQQLELYPDMRPIDDRAFEEGKLAGLAGKPFNPKFGQGTSAYRRFQEGYEHGQDTLAKGFKPLEKPPEDLGDADAQAD